MKGTDEVKRLIADGKTQQAIDLLQKMLEGKDTEILNQTLLLESQFKEFQKQMQLGLTDAHTEINRIKNAMLIICDDVEQLDIKISNKSDAQQATNASLKNALLIFGIVVTLVIGFIVFLVSREDSTKSATGAVVSSSKNTETTVLKSVNEAQWIASPMSAYLRYRLYGEFLIDIINVKSEPNDSENKRLKVKLKMTCQASSSGTCIANYLEYRLEKPNKDKMSPSNNPLYKPEGLVKDRTYVETTVEFDVANDLNTAILHIHYVGLPDVPLVKINLIAK
jgi:Effector-associated domain 11